MYPIAEGRLPRRRPIGSHRRTDSNQGIAPAGTPIALVLYELPLGRERRLLLDVATGMAWLLDGGDEPRDVATASPLARLAMLEWCWQGMPIPTASPLWQLEWAALALVTGEHELWPRAATRLAAALSVLHAKRSSLSPDVARALRLVEQQCARLPPHTAGTAGTAGYQLPELTGLSPLVSRLRDRLRSRSLLRRTGPYSDPLDPEMPGCFEVEWDRVPRFQLDPREHAVLARVSNRSWSVSVPSQWPGLPTHGSGTVRAWARLVDEISGKTAAETPLSQVGGMFSADSELSHPPPQRWYIDISGRPGDEPRGSAERTGVLAGQAVFRAQLLSRFAGLGIGLDDWAAVLGRRADRKLALYQKAKPADTILGTVTRTAAQAAINEPFLAEELLDPTRVALFLSQQ
jgi:hypothetical protein